MMRRTSRRGVVAVVCSAGLVACSSLSSSGNLAAGGGSEEARAHYGEAPPTDPTEFTYQPDVVVVGGGAAAVRSVSADGFVWTVAGDAPGLDGLDVGEVMFLTSSGVGRVTAKERVGDDVAVTLAPVQLQEVIRDGTIDIDTEIDPADAVIHEIPGLPTALSEPEEGDVDLPKRNPDTSVLAAPGSGSGKTLPSPVSDNVKIGVGDWEVTGKFGSDGMTAGISYMTETGLKLGAEVKLGFKSLRLVTNAVIEGGKISAPTTMLLHGVEYVDVSLQAGAANGADDNRKVKIEIPATFLDKPVVVYGIPMVLTFKVKLVIETALGGKNSTLTAAGRWGLDGPLGFESGVPSVPGFSVIHSIIDSIGGIALAPSGLVIAYETKFMLGIGVPGFNAGPYGKLRLSAGVVNGSAFGAPLARCVRADLTLKGGGGAGMSLDNAATKALQKLFPGAPPIKVDLEAEYLATIKQASQTLPNVPLCVGD